MDQFIEPETMEDALTMSEDLAMQVKAIDLALADRNALDENGERMEEADYWEWRQRKLHGKVLLERRLTYLKGWRRRESAKEVKWIDRPLVGKAILDCECGEHVVLDAETVKDVGYAILNHYKLHGVPAC